MGKANRFLVGVDVGGTKVLAGVFNRKFKLLGRARKKTRSKTDPRGRELFARLCECITEAIEDAGLDRGDLAGIGVGAPGPVDAKTGDIAILANLGVKRLPLGDRLGRKFAVPVAVENDVNLGTYGEYHFGAASGGRFVLGVFPGTGIGGGLLIDGRIHRGASGGAGEVGHMVVDPSGPLCGCGHRGCLEAFAGRLVLAGELAAMALRGQAPHLAATATSDVRKIRSGQIAAAIEAGDELVEQAVRREARRIGSAVASLVNVFSPDTVVLGGGLVEAMPKLFVEEVRGAVRDHAMPFIAGFARIVPAELGDDAVMLGAVRLIAERVGPPAPPPPAKSHK